MINELAKEIHAINVENGFYDEEERNMGEILALIHSEVSEALECDRKGLYCSDLTNARVSWDKYDEYSNEAFKHAFRKNIKDTFEDELADILIRVLDLAAYKGIDLERHVALKMKYNAMRQRKHGKRY